MASKDISNGILIGAACLVVAGLMAAVAQSGCGPAKAAPELDITGTSWSDPKAPANTYTFWKAGACTSKYDDRTFSGRWTQSGKSVDFTIDGDGGPVVFHMILGQGEMNGDGFPPGGEKSMFVNLVRVDGP